MKPELTIDEVKNQMATLVSEYMGIDRELVLSGKKFDTLIEHFDSLAMVEIQLLLEKHYDVELNFEGVDKEAFPTDIDELADGFLQQYQRQKNQQKTELKKENRRHRRCPKNGTASSRAEKGGLKMNMLAARRVVVTGMGAVTPLGNNVDDFFANLTAGATGIRMVSELCATRGLGVVDIDMDAHFSTLENRQLDRVSQLALIAARQAIDSAGSTLPLPLGESAGVFFGSGMGGAQSLQEGFSIFTRYRRRRNADRAGCDDPCASFAHRFALWHTGRIANLFVCLLIIKRGDR